MRQPSIIVTIAFSLLFIFTASILAQTETPPRPEASFDVVLNLVAGSNDAGQKSDLPSGFAPITKQLRSTFGYSSFKLVNTYLGRIGNQGSIEYKSPADIFGRSEPQDAPAFLDWRITDLRTVPGPVGNTFRVQSFRFGARIPIRVSSNVDGKVSTSVNYESVGLSVDRMSVKENMPVLVGTLSLPRSDGTLFLILTVKPVEN